MATWCFVDICVASFTVLKDPEPKIFTMVNRAALDACSSEAILLGVLTELWYVSQELDISCDLDKVKGGRTRANFESFPCKRIMDESI